MGKHSIRQKKFYFDLYFFWSFPGSSADKESICNSGDPGSIPGLGRSDGEGTGYLLQYSLGFPSSSTGKESTCKKKKESTCNVGDLGSNPGLGRSPGEGNGYPLQHSGLENSMNCIDFKYK